MIIYKKKGNRRTYININHNLLTYQVNSSEEIGFEKGKFEIKIICNMVSADAATKILNTIFLVTRRVYSISKNIKYQ